jgi:hypothetical protein
MVQGDQTWWCLGETVLREDGADVSAYNAIAPLERRLHPSMGVVPCVGAIATAPIVLLLAAPSLNGHSSPHDYAFTRPGWPLAALHPDAPAGPAQWWRSRVAALVELFGAQHVSQSVAAVYLTPWHTQTFDERLRLPSRTRLLELAATAAARDAIVVMMREPDLWTEHADIASLPRTRRFNPRSWRGTELSKRNLGADEWAALCRRMEIHAWI